MAGAAVAALLVIVPERPATALDATWLAPPATPTGDFNTPANWTPAAVPDGAAFFGATATSALSFSALNTTIGGWTFDPGAAAYTFVIPFARDLIFNGAGIVINGGSAAITNNGFLQFINSSTAGSAAITNNADLSFFNASTAGSAAIANNNLLRFFDASTAGSATITNNAGGVVGFSSTSTAGNATIANDGALQFFDTSTAGRAAIVNNDLLEFRVSSTAGGAAIANNDTLRFFDTSTAGAATIVNNAGGVTTFSNDSTAGVATITANAGGQVVFTDNASGGTARFILNGTGTLDISAPGFGGTTVGSIEGNGLVDLGGNDLAVGGNNRSTTFSGVIDDGGAGGFLFKEGSGTLTLAGTSTYLGGTIVDSGTLLVNGSIASSALVLVGPGATLGGTGTVARTALDDHSTLAPGTPNQIGTLTVNDALLFCGCSFYAVKVSSAANDLTQVTNGASGDVFLDGAVLVSSLSRSYRFNSPYTILTAPVAGIVGTFNSLSLPSGLGGSLAYTATDVLLTLTSNLAGLGGFNQNQQAVALALDGVFNSPGATSGSFGALFGLASADLANALTLLSGEAAAGAQFGAFQLGNQFLSLMLDPFANGRTGFAVNGSAPYAPATSFASEEVGAAETALSYANATKRAKTAKEPPWPGRAPAAAIVYEPRVSMWAGGFGGTSRTQADPVVIGSHDVAARTAGYAAGLDYRLWPDATIGFALAGGSTSWSLANGLGGGSSDVFQAGVYGATHWGAAYLAGAASFAEHWMKTDRTAFLGDHLTASFDAQSYGGRVEGGYRFATFVGGLTPYAALQAQRFQAPAYSEADLSGLGFGLAYNGRTADATRGELGGRFDQRFLFSDGALLALHARAAWAHDAVSDPVLTPVFLTLPGASFVVTGALPATDLALLSAGAELRLANGWSLAGRFDGEFAERAKTYAGTGALRYAW